MLFRSTNDAAWLRLKLDALATVAEERAFEMPSPPSGEKRLYPGVVAATAAGRKLVRALGRSIESHYNVVERSLGKRKLADLYALLDELIALEQPR